MRLIFSESNPDYANYNFPYAVWAIPDSSEEIADLYERGFLPSNKPRFCMARSTRIVLSRFKSTYSTRRTLKSGPDIDIKLIAISDFKMTLCIRKLCHQCADLRFGKGVIDEKRLARIFSSDNATHVMQFTIDRNTVGIVTINKLREIAHYNFAFYDVSQPKRSFGTFMLTAAIDYFYRHDYNLFYMGTCYSKNFLYKARYEGFEFFNGFRWSPNVSELKFLIGRPQKPDHLLESSDYLAKFVHGKLDREFGDAVYHYVKNSVSCVTMKPRLLNE